MTAIKKKKRTKLHLGQENPRDQIYTGIGAIEGNLLNLEDGDCSIETAVVNIRAILRVMRLTLPHLEGVAWNPEKPKREQ